MLIAQIFCATEVNQNTIGSTISSPANLSYEELVYIIQERHGVPQRPRILSPCARAILGCCKQNQINEECSEALGCGAFFFDDNPCDDRFVLDALKAANTFYNQLKRKA
ncbi:unnamed protein product [Arctia plantaginis]|uniref:Uncharacterized protein n=1 Tax=Arctia plantaginis TaxID=874455 RepID=A0A8S1BGZ1_ARCPL|nr:unnamed protein product [Arctia plantaginis]CAB3257798.1 unnamed protein product [Arctia plantaginis]